MPNIWLDQEWDSEEYRLDKKKSFECLESFITTAPKKILDIGCGLAFESELFQKKYGCELYLLDGNSNSNNNSQVREIGFDQSGTFKFYSDSRELTESFIKRNLKYTFVDVSNINISDNVIFDLIYSNLSCGFHYPINTYYTLLKKHSDKNTVMIFDIKGKTLTDQLNDQFEVVREVSVSNKISKYQLKIK